MKYTHIGIDDQAKAVSKLPWQRDGNGDAKAEASGGEDEAWQRSASATRRPNGHSVSSSGNETTPKPPNPKNKTPCEQGVYDAACRGVAGSGTEPASVEAADLPYLAAFSEFNVLSAANLCNSSAASSRIEPHRWAAALAIMSALSPAACKT